MLNRICKRITNNLGLKILAVIFAAALWLAVVNVDDPNTTRTFSVKVEVDNKEYFQSIDKYYEIINKSDMVTFKATGKRSYLERMGNADFRATADLKMAEDDKRVPIEITAQRYVGSVTVVDKAYLEIAVDDLVSQSFMIEVDPKGQPAKGYALGKMVAEPTLLRVTGPAAVVRQIKKAAAPVNVEGMLQDLKDIVPPVLYDKNGREIKMKQKDLSSNVEDIAVSVEILDTKEIGLNFQTMGTLQDGYEYAGMKYTPKTVRVKGRPADLNKLDGITVPEEVLDLTDASGDIEKEVDISVYLPEGVVLMEDSQAKVAVKVTIDRMEQRPFRILKDNISIRNLSDRYSLSFLANTAEVEIKGLSSDLDGLRASELAGYIDVGGMTAGEHTVNVELKLDSQFELVRNAVITVRIAEKGN